MDKIQELQNRLDLLLQFGGVVYKETRLDKLLELIAGQVKKILGLLRFEWVNSRA